MWKRTFGWIATFCMVVAILYTVVIDRDTNVQKVNAKDGILDLAQLNDIKLLSLSGEWKFTENDFVNPKIYNYKAKNQVVPKKWDSDVQFGTYQLLIKLPNVNQEVGLRVRNVWSAHKIYVNGNKLSEIGKIATSKTNAVPENPSYEIYFKPNSKQLLLTMHVANFHNARGGIVFPIDFGDAQLIKLDVQNDVSIESTAIFLLFIFSMFHLTIYLLRKNYVAFFYSGLYFLSLSLVIMTRGERVLLRKFPELSFEFYFRFQDSVTYFSAILFILFIINTMPSIMTRRQINILFLPILIYSLAILLFPARSLSNMQYIFFFYMNFLLLIIIVNVFRVIFQKKWLLPKNEIVSVIFILLFLFLFSFSGSFDQLFFNGSNIFNRIGLLGFVISMNVFVGIRLINRTEAAENLSNRIEKANIAKDLFLEVTLQELKNPVFHAINLTKSPEFNAMKGIHHSKINMIEQLLERFLYLLDDLRDFTQIRFQDHSFEVQSTNARMVIQHIAKLMTFTLSKKQIEFDIKVPETLYVLADEKRLGQVFYRILVEASSYAINGRIEVEAYHEQQFICITFKVNSNQIECGEQSKIKDLLFVRELIEEMNGHFHIKENENSHYFIVQLPFHEYKFVKYSDQEKELETKQFISAGIDVQDSQVILVVEDDPIYAEVLSSILSLKYRVIIAYTAQEALTKLQGESKISFIIIDELMPGMDGVELTKLIRKQYSMMELPIIMTTLDNYPSNIETIFSAGVNDYLIKPVTKDALLARLSAIEQTKHAIELAIENEMAFLQAQIKPHFLYNALSNIISFCYTDGERAAHLLSMLSSYLRYIFESGKGSHHSTLQKELDIIEAYVEVEKARFGERLSFSCLVEKTIDPDKIDIPSLLIQPLVENAIRHGVFEKEGNGTVQLIISLKNDLLHIEIVDDGIGMSLKQCEYLLEGRATSQGIGFANVLRRIREISKGEINLHSAIGKGTSIVLSLPLKVK